MGFTHTALSARLLARWHLPQNLVEAVAADPPTAGGRCHDGPIRCRQILHLAELIARLLADGQTSALARLLELARDYRNLPEDQLQALLGDLEEKVRQLASVLSLQLPEGVQYADILAEAQRQLADVASQAAEDLLRGSPERRGAAGGGAVARGTRGAGGGRRRPRRSAPCGGAASPEPAAAPPHHVRRGRKPPRRRRGGRGDDRIRGCWAASAWR